jgi:hypothetical protein
MVTTPHLGLTLVEQAQAQKEVTVNMALMRLDAVLNSYAKDKDLAIPPTTPAQGDVYIVGASPTGDWAGHAGHIAYFDQIWRFITPRKSMSLWVEDDYCFYDFDGTLWRSRNKNRESLTLRAGAELVPTLSAGCAAAANLSLGSTFAHIITLDFDATTQESAQFVTRLPEGWIEGTISAAFHWSHATASGSYGVVWQLEARSLENGSSLAQAYGANVTIADTGGSANTLYISDETASLSVTGTPANNSLITLRVSRLSANASDTLSVDARLHAVTLFFTAYRN